MKEKRKGTRDAVPVVRKKEIIIINGLSFRVFLAYLSFRVFLAGQSQGFGFGIGYISGIHHINNARF